MTNDLSKLFHDAVDYSRRRNQRLGVKGKTLSTGQVVYDASENTVWVTLDDGVAIEVFDNKTQRAQIDVIVEPGSDGVWRVVDVQQDKVRARYGAKATAVAAPIVSGDLSKDPVDSRRITYALVYATSDAFKAIIREWEYRYNGTDVVFPATEIDLAIYVPASGYQRWVKVGVNPATNAAVIVQGDSFLLSVPMGRSQLNLIDFAALGYEPLSGVLLKGGQTQLYEDAFIDARLWLGSSGGSTGNNIIAARREWIG